MGLRPRVLVLLGMRGLLEENRELSRLFEDTFDGFNVRKPHSTYRFEEYQRKRFVFREWNSVTVQGSPLWLVDWPQHASQHPFTIIDMWRAASEQVRGTALLLYRVTPDACDKMKIPMLTRLLLLALVVGPLAAWAFLQADSCSRTRAPEWAGANRANELICVADFVRQADKFKNSSIHPICAVLPGQTGGLSVKPQSFAPCHFQFQLCWRSETIR